MADLLGNRRIVVVTGTGTEIGKTMVTAALAAQALAAGQRVCVIKPVQTGVRDGEPGDIAEVRRLLAAGGTAAQPVERLELHEFFRLPDALGPQAAARRAGVSLPPVKEHAERIRQFAQDADLTLVEGAGGLLVRLDDDGATIADLAGLLLADGPGDGLADGRTHGTGVVIVAQAGLGTLNVTELTVEACRHRGLPVLGVVIGSWPAGPGLAELDNLTDLPAVTGVPLLGAIPAGPPLPPRLRTAAELS
jgi:dethiobiotin synthetase